MLGLLPPEKRRVSRHERSQGAEAGRRKEIAAYIDAYHHRPHSGLRYRTPAEVRQTREDGQ